MTPDEFLERVEAIIRETDWDHETCHQNHDRLMLKVLKELGFSEGVKRIEEQDRWYS